jgi:hypothetical protein
VDVRHSTSPAVVRGHGTAPLNRGHQVEGFVPDERCLAEDAPRIGSARFYRAHTPAHKGSLDTQVTVRKPVRPAR